MNQSVNHKAVCRTAVATPGLLTRRGRPRHSASQLRELGCPPLFCCLGVHRAVDFRHSELAPVCTWLSPYYAVRLCKLDQVLIKSHNNTFLNRTKFLLDHVCTHFEESEGFLIKTKIKDYTKLIFKKPVNLTVEYSKETAMYKLAEAHCV